MGIAARTHAFGSGMGTAGGPQAESLLAIEIKGERVVAARSCRECNARQREQPCQHTDAHLRDQVLDTGRVGTLHAYPLKNYICQVEYTQKLATE